MQLWFKKKKKERKDRGTFHSDSDPEEDSKFIPKEDFLENMTVITRTGMDLPGKHCFNLASLLCLSRKYSSNRMKRSQ